MLSLERLEFLDGRLVLPAVLFLDLQHIVGALQLLGQRQISQDLLFLQWAILSVQHV